MSGTEAAGSLTHGSVLDLADIRITDSHRVGPKVARLAHLAAAGWPVPDGYAVTADALGRWLPEAARTELARLFAAPAGAAGDTRAGDTRAEGAAGLHQLAERAQQLIESHPLPPWLAEAVAEAHERLRARTGLGRRLRVAVRSSAVSEDGARSSFAGQYATFLGAGDVDAVLAHIRQCWASGFTAHALAYRRRAGDEALHEHDLAVGVLELVDARSAGVVFTLDPVTGDRGRAVVEANWGFGESVVSGQVTPDRWVVDKESGTIVERAVGAKHLWSALDPASGTVVLAPQAADLAARPCLDEAEVRYLCAKAAEIESAEGVPQDVEWAIARGTPLPGSVVILQHRPETAWANPPAPDGTPAAPAAGKAYDPVQYALRNVFKVPGR